MSSRVGWIQDLEGTAEQLNAGAIWKALDLAQMAAIPDTTFGLYANDRDIYCLVRDFGPYRWQAGFSLYADGESVVNGANGQWVQEGLGEIALTDFLNDWFSDLLGDIPEGLAAKLANFEARISALE